MIIALNKLENKVVSFNVNNLKEGKVKDISLSNKQEFENFNSYTLSFYISFDSIGEYSFDDATISVQIDNPAYKVEKNIGRYNISIYEKNDSSDIEIIGGTALQPINSSPNINDNDYVNYPVEYRIKNNTNNKIYINNIHTSSNNNVKIDMKPIVIDKNKEAKINFNILLKGNISNSIIKPIIEYSTDNIETKIFSTTPMIIADPVPEDRLYELINNEIK